MNVKTLTAEEILEISLDRPERLFTIDNLKEEVRQLNKLWHPDVSKHPDATIVFQRIQFLKKTAEERIANNTWDGPAKLTFWDKDTTSEFIFRYRRVVDFDIGRMYIGQKHIVYVIDSSNEDLFENGIKTIQDIKYPAKKFEDEFKKQMPNIIRVTHSNIGFVLVLEKTPDLVLLRDLLDYLPNNKMDPRHMAWIMSTLCNLACFLELNNIAHCGLVPDNIWISPANHYAVLLGGWWYARKEGNKLLALPSNVISILPSSVFSDKKAKLSFDRMLIKATGLECVGDTTHTGSMVLTDKTIPAGVLNWLRSPSAKSATEEYRNWAKAREGFGPRKFVELVVDIDKIY